MVFISRPHASVPCFSTSFSGSTPGDRMKNMGVAAPDSSYDTAKSSERPITYLLPSFSSTKSLKGERIGIWLFANWWTHYDHTVIMMHFRTIIKSTKSGMDPHRASVETDRFRHRPVLSCYINTACVSLKVKHHGLQKHRTTKSIKG